jgi:hypothetical protein
MMTQVITCKFCGATISHHWQVQLHARCKPPVVERAARAIPAPPGQEGATSMTWCRSCNTYHLKAHPPIGRHVKRALTKMLREW